jgi:hypothetical protein
VPQEPKSAIVALVSAGIGAAIVYYAPSNKETLAVKPAEKSREPAGGFAADRLAA